MRDRRRHGAGDDRRNYEAGDRGLALIAVIVATGILLALVGPFLVGMGEAGRAAENEAAEREARMLASSLRDSLLQNIAVTQGMGDATPDFDGSTEFPVEWKLPSPDGDPKSKENPLGLSRATSAEVLDLQSRIHAPTAPPQIWANALGLYAILEKDLDVDETELIEVTGSDQLPESGFVWIDHELIKYERKTENGLEGLTRGFAPGGATVPPDTIPDPYGPPAKHASGRMIHDARIRLLVTWQFDEGGANRKDFRPWKALSELPRIGEKGLGELQLEDLDKLRPWFVFDAARPQGAAFGKEERVFNAIVPGETNRLAVKDGTSFPAGTVIRARTKDSEEWALVIRQGNRARGTTVTLPSGGRTLVLDRPIHFGANEEEARIEPLLPMPINVNTASPEVLALLFEAVRSRRLSTRHGLISYPFSKTKARQIAERIALQRSPDEEAEEPMPQPFSGWEDLDQRALIPLVDEGIVEKQEIFHVYALVMNGLESRLDQASIPLCFESSGLVRYRAAAAVLSGAGQTLARRELSGLAMPQPSRAVERFYATQAEFDEASRLQRSRPYWSTTPINTTVRFGSRYDEPPDMSVAHLMPYLHGKAARFPSSKSADSGAVLGTSRVPDLGPLNYKNGFDAEEHPEGLDLSKQKAFRLPTSVPAQDFSELLKAFKAITRNGNIDRIPMAYGNGAGMGMTFGYSAWYKPKTLREAILFDLAGTEAFRNRIFLSLDSEELVLRLYDNAGQDPQPGETNPRETCLRWVVPLAGNSIEADLWFHTAIEIGGGSPASILVCTDGAPRGKSDYLTRSTSILTDATMVPQAGKPLPWRDGGVTLPIPVEDAESFPQKGVVRIGNELFEYTGRSGNLFNLARADSMGGRMARGTFRVKAPKSGTGGPGFGAGGGNQLEISQQGHPSGATVELYGYSAPILENAFVLPGKGSLGTGALGRWSPARVKMGPDDVILRAGQQTLRLGKGLSKDTKTAKLDIVGSDGIGKATGFENPGYAVLIQRHWTWKGPPVRGRNQTQISEEVGGVEIVKYSGFDGSSVSIERGNINLGTLPPTSSRGAGAGQRGGQGNAGTDIYRMRHYVAEWDETIFQNGKGMNDKPQMWAWLVPISISVSGGLTSLPDPAVLGYSEWVQLLDSNDENKTEWVRYDKVTDSGTQLLRVNRNALSALQQVLTGSQVLSDKQMNTKGSYDVDADGRVLIQPPRSGRAGIGEPNAQEDAQTYSARLFFRFRGDPFTGTATHDHQNPSVLPCFRTVLDRGLTYGRPGRGDRVALMTGAASDQQGVQWNTVNWSARIANRYQSPVPLEGSFSSYGGDSAGPSCNLVALKDEAGVLLNGTKPNEDVRFLDRVVKFPSGELPMRLGTHAIVGDSDVDKLPFDGVVDNVQGYFANKRHVGSIGSRNRILGTLRLPATEGDQVLTAFIPVSRLRIGGGAREGLALIGQELVGFTSFDRQSGEIQIAANGRGMLGTDPSGHDVGERIIFISSRPAAHLIGGMTANSDSIPVSSAIALPRSQGTVLIGQELMHYSWMRTRGGAESLLQMPAGSVQDEDGEESISRGLFRGRYGTQSAGHGSGEMVVSWPFRYWDRYTDRADDPELAYFGISADAPDLFLTEVTWQEEVPESSMDLILLVRGDERVPWSADPEKSFGLWRFDDPKPERERGGRRVMAQASRWDFRFHVLYRSGAFDPVRFLGTAWKRTPKLKSFAWSYQSKTRILQEEVTLR